MAYPQYTRGYQPGAAGAITPQKYTAQGLPSPGKNYMIWGEQSGYIYNPYTDHYDVDPAVAKKYGQATGQIAADPEKQSLTDTLLPVAAVSGATALSTELGKQVPGLIKGLISPSAPATGATGVGQGATMATDAAAMQNLGSLGGGAGSGIAQGGTAAGESALLDSSFLGETGAASAEGASGAGGLIGTGGSFFNTAGMFGPQGTMAAGNILGAAGGGLMVYDASQSQDKTRGIGEGVAGGALAGFSVGGPIGAGIGAVVGGALGATAHETTSHRANRRFSELQEGTTDEAFKQLLEKGKQESVEGLDTWNPKDGMESAPIDLLTRSYGVLKTFGPEWMKYSPEQQQNGVKALLVNNAITTGKGDYLINDPDAAKQIVQSAVGAPTGQTTAAPTTQASSGGSGGGLINYQADIMPTSNANQPQIQITPGQDALAPAPESSPIAISVNGNKKNRKEALLAGLIGG